MKKRTGTEQPSVLTIANRPVYFHSGIYTKMDESSSYTSEICYLDRHGLDEGWDKTFGAKIVFDFPLLEGYRHRFLRNFGWDRSDSHFFSRINPGIIPQVFKHDVIFFVATSTMSHWLALFTAILLRKKMIWRGEATLPAQPEAKPGWGWRIKRPLIRFFLNRCHALMYSCTGNREFIESFGLDKPLYPIWCAVDNEYYRKEFNRWKRKKRALRTEWNISDDTLVIIFPARLVERKNPFLLIEALASMPKKKRDSFCALFVGSGALRSSLEKACRERSVNAVFTGFQSPGNLSRFYSMADIYVNLAWEDFSPKAVNEAMNFDLPVVLSRAIGTAADLVPDGKNGFLIDPTDTAALRNALLELRSPAMRRKMGKLSGKIVSNFNFDDNARNIEAAVNDLPLRKFR